jgi:acyl carrier protein
MLEKVRSLIANELGVDADTITEDSHIIDDLGADSLDAVELIMALEEAFDIEIDDDAASEILTVQDILDYLETVVD